MRIVVNCPPCSSPTFTSTSTARCANRRCESSRRPPDEIRVAIEHLGAERIGHGTTLLQDPSVLDLVVERRVVIEACVTSNVHTGAIARAADHPLPRWLELGVRACICCDNTLLSDTNAREECARVRAIPGMTDELVARAVANGHAGAFARGA
jgi:adenosine deaminase